VSFSRHVGPADQRASYYQYIPFEVARQWPSVTVRLSYDRSMAVIDLGLFSPDLGHANCLGETGWVDFRLAPDAWACHAVTHGGLLSVNHPVTEPCSWQYPITPGPGAVELWYQSWDR
jgi:hypothetical protein